MGDNKDGKGTTFIADKFLKYDQNKPASNETEWDITSLIIQAEYYLEPKNVLEKLSDFSVSFATSLFNAESKLITGKEMGAVKVLGKVDNEEKEKIESQNYDKAKALVNKKATGVFILASNGDFSLVGNHHEKVPAPSKEYIYLKEQVLEALKSGGIIDAKEKVGLNRLDATLPDIAMVVSDDGKSAVIADRNGNHDQIGISDIPIENAGLLNRQVRLATNPAGNNPKRTK